MTGWLFVGYLLLLGLAALCRAAYWIVRSLPNAPAKAAAIEASGMNERAAAVKARRDRERRCFWTRPFGHPFQVVNTDDQGSEYKCVSCGKESY